MSSSEIRTDVVKQSGSIVDNITLGADGGVTFVGGATFGGVVESNNFTGDNSITASGSFNGVTATILDGFNFASIVRNTTGNYTVTFEDPMADINYIVATSCNTSVYFSTYGNKTVNFCYINIVAYDGTPQDATEISFIITKGQ